MTRALRLLAAALLLPALTVEATPIATSFTSVADTTLFNENGTVAGGADDGVFVGVTRGGEVRRALLRFDLSGLPANAVVSAVTLQVTVTRNISTTTTVDAYRVTESWGEGSSTSPGGGGGGGAVTNGSATWTHRDWPNLLWTTAGGDFLAAPSASTVIGTTNTSYTFSGSGLVSDVQAWVDGSAGNQGWLLRTQSEAVAPSSARRLGSRENAITTNRPLLTVTYEVPAAAPTQVPVAPWALLLLGAVVGISARRQLSRLSA
jgi:hypothetical protein